MGNASAKEGENGHMASSPELAARNGGGSSSAGGAAARPPPLSPPDAVMLEPPPPVPYLFAPQVPVTPLQRPTDFSPVFNHSPINGTDESTNNHSPEKGIPTLITWSQGGNEVFLEGSWDNWASRRALERSGKDHTILLVIPSGVYHYRVIVDGELRYIPEQPYVTDERGQVANLLDVHVSKDTVFLFIIQTFENLNSRASKLLGDYVPESLDSVAEFEAPPSPEHSYDLQYPGDEEFAKEPPTLPPQLLMSVLGDADDTDEQTPKPQHVVLNHLFIEKGWGSQSLLALGVTHRFESKYVSFVLYKPLRR